MAIPSWLQGLYLFMTVVGVGVTAVDMLGLFGNGDHDGNAAGGAADSEAEGNHGSRLILLRYVRLAIYFALGFGPLGLVAGVSGNGVLGSLAWAVPGGIASAWLARLFFRWQQRDIDSSVRDHELLAERALVLVPLSHKDMGRVRLKVGQSIVERYALAEDAGDTFRTDEVVEVVRVTDECVYVRRSEGSLSLDTAW